MTNYWALSADPSRYRVQAAVAELADSGATDRWTTRGSRVRAGDKALIWKQRGDDALGRRGVVGLADVLTDAAPLEDEDNPYWIPADIGGVEDRVLVRYREVAGFPLWIDGPAAAAVEALNASRAHGGTVFRVTAEQWAAVLDHLPLPAAPTARRYLRRLVGQDVFTITARNPNRILDLADDHVLVGTARSPAGQRVPLEEVDEAIERLHRDDVVHVDVDRLGSHRSSFLGAVLASLPHAITAEDPQRVWLAGQRATAVEDQIERIATLLSGERDPAEGPAVGLEQRRLVWHLMAEGRNRSLARGAISAHGTRCRVCGVDYVQRHGPIGWSCVEAHHLTPFRELSTAPIELSAADDFAIVCSNCHRMLHSESPPLTTDALRAILDDDTH